MFGADRKVRVHLEAVVNKYRDPVREADRDTTRLHKHAKDFARGDYTAKFGADTGGAKRELSTLEKRLQQLAASNTEPRVNLDTDEARRDLTNVQNRLQQLAATVAEAKLQVDDDAALSKLNRIESGLLTVGRRVARPEVDLQGLASAESELATLTSQLQRFDGQTYTANVRVDGSLRASKQISNLVAVGLALGPALVPAAAAASGAMLGLGSAAGVAAAGAGASSLAFMGVGDALDAMAKAETAAASNATDAAARQVQASRQVADAKAALEDAQRQAARAAVDGAQRVADASRAVEEAEEAQAAAAREGLRDIREAKAEVTQARADAAHAASQAAQQVEDAEEQLAQAHQRVRFALEDLHEARQQAIRDLRDLREETRDNALTIEGAEISLAEARNDLRKATRDSKTTELELRDARYQVALAEDRLGDARRDARRDRAELTKAEREGIRNADGVVDARRNVQEAERGVRDAVEGVERAQQAQARTQRQSAAQITEAVRGVAEARREAAERNEAAAARVEEAQIALGRAEQDAARSRADAARQVEAAQRNVERAIADMTRKMAEQSSEVENLREKMAALSPAGRDFAKFLFSLKPRLEELQAIAQRGMFPGVEAGIRDLLELWPELTRLVRRSSGAMGNLAEDAGDALTSPFWRDFFGWLADEAGPKTRDFGRIVGNLGTGFAGLTMHSDDMADGVTDDLLRMSNRFRRWGKTLDENQEYQEFVDYVQRVSPKVWRTIGAVADALFALVEAAAPVGEVSLPVIRGLARAFEAVMESPAGPVIVGAATGMAVLNRSIRGYDVVRHSRLVELLGGTATRGRHARRRLGNLAGFLGSGGPWGLALAAGIGALMFWSQQQAEADQRVDDLRESLNSQTGALTRNSKQKIINTLLDEGALKAARRLGISIEDVTRAAFGERDAIRRVRRALQGHTQAVGGAMTSTRRYTGDAKTLSDALFRQHGETAKARDEFSLLKAAEKALADQSNKTERQTDQHRKALKGIAGQLDLTDRQTERLMKEYDRLTRSSKGSENQGKLHKDQLRKVADQLDLTREQTQKLIRKYDNVPNRIKTDVDTPGMNRAINRTDRLHTKLKKLEGKYNVWVGDGVRVVNDPKNVGPAGVSAFAGGGPVDGPRVHRDVVPSMLTPGEFVVREDGSNLADAFAYFARGFADGGPVTPDINVHVQSSVTKALLEWANQIKSYDISRMGAVSGAGAPGVRKWADEVAAALAIMGQPQSLVGVTLARMNQESGGVVDIVNKWDSNWFAGHPSVGLMQVIGPTYRSWAHPRFDVGPYLYGTSINPMANILASMRYALGEYGSLVSAYTRAGGYDQGGMLPPGLSLAYNGTGTGEHMGVFNTAQWRSLEKLATAAERATAAPRAIGPLAVGGDGAAARGRGGDMHITVMLGDRELGEVIVDPLRKAVRTRGGDVQAVLGRS